MAVDGNELTLLKNRCESAFGDYQLKTSAVQEGVLALPENPTKEQLEAVYVLQRSAKQALADYESAKAAYLHVLFGRTKRAAV